MVFLWRDQQINEFPTSWSADGRFIAYHSTPRESSSSILIGQLFGRRGNRVGVIRVGVSRAVPVMATVAAQAAVRFDVKDRPKKIFVEALAMRSGELGASTAGADKTRRRSKDVLHHITLVGGCRQLNAKGSARHPDMLPNSSFGTLAGGSLRQPFSLGMAH